MTSDQSSKPNQKLRWYQFSLRSLLIFVTLIAVLCSWFAVQMQHAERQREAVEVIRKKRLGVWYNYHGRVLETSLNSKAEPPGPAWLYKLLGVDLFYHVEYVFLRGEEVTNEDLEYFKELNQVAELDLGETRITDEGLEQIKGLKHLKILFLNNTKITDAGLKHLEGLHELRRLDVPGTRVTQAGIDQLKKSLPNVEIELHEYE